MLVSRHWGDKQFLFMVEQAQLLTESGHDGESDRLIDAIFSKAGHDNGAADMLHFQYAINALNRGNVNLAAHHLKTADSIAVRLRGDEDAYFRSYSNLLHAMIDFRQTGRIKLMHINRLNNRQTERFNRMKASQWESERGALHQQNRALTLKAESGHKTVIILIISLAALLILGGSAWIFIIRRQRERDNEERAEALQKMVDELQIRPGSRCKPIKPIRLRPCAEHNASNSLALSRWWPRLRRSRTARCCARSLPSTATPEGELVDWGQGVRD